MSYIVDNAVIMAAGVSSRFAPLSYEKPKALVEVNGEILIERQIQQLKEAGIEEIIIVVGYMKEKFRYLKDKLGVYIVENNDYLTRNNNASIYAVKEYLGNTYICSADNYFVENPFEKEVDDSYYAAVYADSETKEWCMRTDEYGYINDVQIGGANAWYMLGHAFWNREFSKKFIEILCAEYDLPVTVNLLWESIYIKHLDILKMKMRKYDKNIIFEFDSLDELRLFDSSYNNDTRSEIIKWIAAELACSESDITDIVAVKGESEADIVGFEFRCRFLKYVYFYNNHKLEKLIRNCLIHENRSICRRFRQNKRFA